MMAGEGGAAPAKSSELRLRVISAIVLALVALGSAWIGGMTFAFVWSAISALVCFEWVVMTRNLPSRGLWAVGGLLYAQALLVSVVGLRLSEGPGLVAILFLFAVVWAADIAAYFTGRKFGGPKLAPSISPGKTWSGMAGGVAGGVIAGLALIAAFGIAIRPAHVVIAAVLTLASVAGDLFESWIKRRSGVKDSSQLIPGHGGFMDRLDAFIVASALAGLIGTLHSGLDRMAAGLLLW